MPQMEDSVLIRTALDTPRNASGVKRPAEREGIKLKRRLGLIHGVAVICGLIIGGGIYITPKGVIQYATSPGLVLSIWAFCGLMGILGALCSAEMGTTFPQSGEKYYYLQQMYGPFAGFMYLWMFLMFSRPAFNAVKCLIFASYVQQPAFPNCAVDESGKKMLAVLLACLLTFANIVNVKWAARGQVFLTSISIFALIVIGITGVVHLATGHTDRLAHGFEGSTTDVNGLVLAIYSCTFSYSGWSALNFMTEELKDPYRNLPRAICISMALTTVLYVLVNTAYIAVLGTGGILATDALAVHFTQKIFGTVIAATIPVVIALNTAGSFNSGTLVASRLCFAGARGGHLPEVLSYININFSSPITALIFQAALVILMTMLANMYTLINNLVFANSLFNFVAVGGLIWLRFKQPDLPRPLKMPILTHTIFLVFAALLVVIPLIWKPVETGMGLLFIICTGIPYYVIFIAVEQKPLAYRRVIARMNHFVQKILFCVSQEGEVFA